MLAGYGHFLRIAARARWDDEEVDLREDARDWRELPPPERDPLLDLLAGFCLGEERVALELEPFAVAAGGDAAACLRAQARDEERHARFFHRVASEVAAVPEPELRARLDPAFVGLFEDELPAAARRLARDHAALGSGIGLYHLLLEGVVFSAGQSALLERLERLAALPGLTLGLERVIRDERWHIGLGVRCLADARPTPREAEGLLAEGERCARAWGRAVPERLVAEAVRLHRRRLRAAGLLREAVAA